MRTGGARKRGGTYRSIGRALAIVPALLVAGCIPQAQITEAPTPPANQKPLVLLAQQVPEFPPPPPPRPPADRVAQRQLEQRIQELGRGFNGDIGIAVRDIQTGFTASFDGNSWFPQQSVSKFWVALTALDRADRGHMDMSDEVTVRREDLTLFHQPIAQQIGTNGYRTTLSSLMNRAITQSDNTANDFVLWRAGGPEAVRSFLTDRRISGIRFGPGEREMQSRLAGMEWNQSMSVGRAFYAARATVPQDVRRAAFESYVRDPVDGATPVGLVNALARLQRGELLSPESTRLLLRTMENTRTGPQRLKGGLAPGWTIAHKTGTGQVFGAQQTGYNDIGIVRGPDGRAFAVAVMIRRTAAPIPERMQVMQNATRAVIAYASALEGRAAPQHGPQAPVDLSGDDEGD
jgi:beta-lactamase class A